MSSFNANPSITDLKKFGLLFAVMLCFLFGLLIPVIRHGIYELSLWPLWPWFAAGLISLCAFLHPASLKLLYQLWMKFAEVAQWVNTRIIMLIMFYLLILPIGLLLKLFGKDSMQRRFEEDTQSYRVPSESCKKDHMEKPY
ncbi:MAG: hypothetical protein ACI9H8_002086 [Lysobacterales bacterium]|jgi:hypothetical protein